MLNRNLISRHSELSKMQSEMQELEQLKQQQEKSANSIVCIPSSPPPVILHAPF